MRGTGLVSGIVTFSLALSVGCGDPPICQSDVFVAIQTSQIVEDVDTVTPGVQAEIRVRTSLTEGDVTLDVLDAQGRSSGTLTAPVDPDGNVVFHGVSVETPITTLQASVHSLCGDAADAVTIDVIAGAGCELALVPAPEVNAYYQPLRVLSTVSDPDPNTSGYQTSVVIKTRPGWAVELFQNPGTGEQSVGTSQADSGGLTHFDGTLLDGRVTFRATCRGSGISAASIATTVLVDTQPPACTFTNPSPGSTITPAFDQNHDLADGVQLAIAAQISGPDVEGEPVGLTITPAGGAPMMVTASTVDATGASAAATTLMPATTPAAFEFALATQDHAGNRCTSTQSFDVIYDGCDIAVTAPTSPVTVDADGNPGNGSQVDFTLQVASACVGRTVTSTCGTSSPGGIVPIGGQLTLRADICTTSPCEAMASCTFRVTTAAGVQTSASTTIEFDDQGPPVSLDIISPPLACGAQITPATDADPGTDGVQIIARVTSPAAASRSLELTNGTGTSSLDAATDVTVTLVGGVNRLVGVGLDALNNRSQTANCTLTLADLSVSFSPPAADGSLNRSDGTVVGTALMFPLCGTVNRTGATVQLSIDGAAAVPATVTGTTWCRTVTLAQSPPSHTIVASATEGTSFGSGSLVLSVDVVAPPSVVSLTATPVNRQRIHMTWQAPSDAGQPVASQVVKFATTTITDANFNTTGTVIPTPPPGAPGANESADVFPARTGLPYWVAIATFDAAGNRSPASIIGPITPTFDRSGALTAPDPTQGTLALGFAIAHGKFNDDAFDDLAISAPTQNTGATLRTGAVYVYFGGPSGIAATPDLVITDPTANGMLGSGLTAVRWSSTTRDDLVVGAPGVDGHGHIFVFRGGATFGAGTRTAATADLHIAANPTTPGWFATGGLGSSLVTADVDGDGSPDLVAAAPTGGSGAGGVVILYGGTVTANVLLSDLDSAGNPAICELFKDPGSTPGRQLGYYLHAVGHTEGPADTTDDLVVVYTDDYGTATDSLFVLRSNGTRPSSAGVTARSFAIGRDVRLDYSIAGSLRTEWGSQAISIADQDGDDARDLVISAFRGPNDIGQVVIVSGHILGTGGVATTADAGVTLTRISGVGSNARFGAAIVGRDGAARDIDGDGLEDLMIGGRLGNAATGFVWFGGAIPVGTSTMSSAPVTISAPATFGFTRQMPKGLAGQARWVGDLDGDGLEDVCWSSPFDSGGDGTFEILAD